MVSGGVCKVNSWLLNGHLQFSVMVPVIFVLKVVRMQLCHIPTKSWSEVSGAACFQLFTMNYSDSNIGGFKTGIRSAVMTREPAYSYFKCFNACSNVTVTDIVAV